MTLLPKAKGPFKPAAHARLVLVGTLLVVNLAVLLIVWNSLQQGRQHREEQARVTGQNLAQVLERNLSWEIQALDLALFSVRREIAREQATGGISSSQLDACIQEIFTQYPYLDSIRTANAAGEIDHGIGVPPGSRASVADRDYFQTLKQDASAGLVITRPVLGRISQKWVIILARRFDARGGGFGGVVYGVITLDRFAKALSVVDPGPKGSVVLRDGDLGLVARYPYTKDISDRVGDRTLTATFQGLVGSGKAVGTYTTRAALDGVERTFSYRKVGPYPFYVNVGLASDDYLAQWQREARITWGTFLLFCLFSTFLGTLLHRAWRRQEERIQELSLTLEEVRTLQGFLPICMYCKKIRDDQNYWSQIEQYITTHTGTKFSHGICPECRSKAQEEFRDEIVDPGGEKGIS